LLDDQILVLNCKSVPNPSYRLLVVDDEPLALKLAERVFEGESDIKLQATTSPRIGLEIATLEDIDLVIADQRMPEMSGLSFLGRLREIRPRALRLLLTAYPDMAVALQAINEGLVYRFVLKPWDLDDMRVTVRRTLETKRLSDEHDKLVAQLKNNYDELIRSERMAALGRLSAGIGHELSNAVTPLLAHISVMEADVSRLAAGGADRLSSIQESLAVMREAGKQLESLVRGVKGYARSAEPAPFDVNQAVLSAAQLLSHRFRHSIRLERELKAVPLVRCRGPEITQVVLNLLGNAADAVEAREGAQVRVRTWPEGAKVRIEVADNGPGLDPDVAPRLFQPFVSTKASEGGTGLGLSICRSIVESHGGSIEAASLPGSGARFTVTLPAAV
jgi:signal transduction histidine kinase